MKSLKPTIGLLAATLLWAGCTTVQVQAVRHTATGIESKEAIALLFWRQSPPDRQDAPPIRGKIDVWRQIDEKEIVTCVSDEVRKAQPSLRVVPQDEFRRVAFPDLPPEAAPNSPEYLTLLLNHATFRERISSLGIRYLIFLRGATEEKGDASAGGVAGPGAGVLVIGGSWDRNTRLSASILDLKQSREAGSVAASASGRPWFFAVLPSPLILGMPAFTESKACGELGQELVRFLAGERQTETEEDQKWSSK